MIFGPLLGCSNYRIALLDVVVTGEYTRDNVIIKFELISFQMICCYILHKKAWHWQSEISKWCTYFTNVKIRKNFTLFSIIMNMILYIDIKIFQKKKFERNCWDTFRLFYWTIFEDGLCNIWPKQIITCSEVHIGMFVFGLLLPRIDITKV